MTVNNDWAVSVSNADSGSAGVISSLVDGSTTATLSTVYVTGGYAVELDQITSSALTTIDASTETGTLALGQAVGTGNGPLGNAGITVKASTAATTAYLSGAADIVTLNSTTTTAVGGGNLYLSGAGDTVSAAVAGTQGAALAIYASGSGDTIDVSKVTSNTSKGLTIQGATSASAVGSNAIVKLGVGISGLQQTVYAGVNTTVNAGSNYETVDVTKASAAYGTTTNMTTVQLGTSTAGAALTSYGTSDLVKFGNSESALVAVNAAQATSLASALTIAATATTSASATLGLAWFQYGGDTYLYEHVGSSTTAVGATDVVVKIVGIHDVTSISTGAVTIGN